MATTLNDIFSQGFSLRNNHADCDENKMIKYFQKNNILNFEKVDLDLQALEGFL